MQFTAIDNKGKILSFAPLTPLVTVVNSDYHSLSCMVESTSTLPLRIGLVVDTSNSVQQTFVDHVVGGAVRFLGATLKPNDGAFIISVKSEASLFQDWTSDGKVLFEAVNKLRAGGGTAIYDGVYFACKKLAAEPAAARKAVILASDGDDNQSHVSLNETTQYCSQHGVAVFALDYSGPLRNELGRGERALKALAEKTGGLYYAPKNDKEIIAATDQFGYYWNAQYLGTATFQTLPEDKKIKNIYVVSTSPSLKFKATLLLENGQ